MHSAITARAERYIVRGDDATVGGPCTAGWVGAVTVVAMGTGMVPLTAEQRRLVADHHRLVGEAVSIALAGGWRGTRSDAVSAAGWGLCRAAATWDPAKGAPFRAHALRRMIGQVRRLSRGAARRREVLWDPLVMAATSAVARADDPVARTLGRLDLEAVATRSDWELLEAVTVRGGAAALARRRGVTEGAVSHAVAGLRRRLTDRVGAEI